MAPVEPSFLVGTVSVVGAGVAEAEGCTAALPDVDSGSGPGEGARRQAAAPSNPASVMRQKAARLIGLVITLARATHVPGFESGGGGRHAHCSGCVSPR